MYKKISIFLLIFIFMSVSFLFGQDFKEADNFFSEGLQLYKEHRYKEAIQKLTAAMEIDITLGASRKIKLGFDYGCLAYCYMGLNQYDNALKFNQKALAIAEELGRT